MAARKSERLVNLVICLLTARSYLTHDEIRRLVTDYHGMPDAGFRRAFERDKDALRALGVPLETGPSDPWRSEADGYRIRRGDFELPPLSFTPAEATVIGIATSVWGEAAIGASVAAAVAKLESDGTTLAGGGGARPALAVSLPTKEPAFPVAWDALLRRQRLVFTYHGRTRDVAPWRLILRSGAWYLLGDDRGVGPRLFRLSRVEGVPTRRAGAPYAIPGAAELDSYLAKLEPPAPTQRARIALAPARAPRLRRRGTLAGTYAVPGEEAPYDVVEVPYAREDEIAAEVLTAGAAAVVLEPAELRMRVVEGLRAVAALGGGHDAYGLVRDPAGADGVTRVDTAAGKPARDLQRISVSRVREDSSTWSRSDESCDQVKPTAENVASTSPVTGHGVTHPSSDFPAATRQAARLLTLIPYLQSHRGVTLAEAAARFHTTPATIRKDLDVAFFCGLPGGLPGDLIDVDMDLVDEEGVIILTNAPALTRPLRLTPTEVTGLVVALAAIRAVTTGEVAALVDGVLGKLVALEPVAGSVATIGIAGGEAAIRDTIATAIRGADRLRLTYDGAVRDTTTDPVVDPVRLFVRDGAAYLLAWSLDRAAWRTYRVDRIQAAEPTGQTALAHGPVPAADAWLRELTAARRVRLDLAPAAAWIVDYVPVTEHVTLASGNHLVTLSVVDEDWLTTLLLRLGGAVVGVDPAVLAADAVRQAWAALAHYA